MVIIFVCFVVISDIKGNALGIFFAHELTLLLREPLSCPQVPATSPVILLRQRNEIIHTILVRASVTSHIG